MIPYGVQRTDILSMGGAHPERRHTVELAIIALWRKLSRMLHFAHRANLS